MPLLQEAGSLLWANVSLSWKIHVGLRRQRELTWSCSWLRSKKTWRKAWPVESWGRLLKLNPHLRWQLMQRTTGSSCLQQFLQTHQDVFSRRPPEKRHKISTVRRYRWTVPPSCVEDPCLFMPLQERSCRRPRCCLHSDSLSRRSLSLSLSLSSFPQASQCVII